MVSVTGIFYYTTYVLGAAITGQTKVIKDGHCKIPAIFMNLLKLKKKKIGLLSPSYKLPLK